MIMTFDPNEQIREIKSKIYTYDWATYIPDRTTAPKFKIHANRGHALNAVKGASNAILYHKIKDRWEEIFRVEGGILENCPHGGSSHRWGNTDVFSHTYSKWINKHTDTPKLISCCRDCFYTP